MSKIVNIDEGFLHIDIPDDFDFKPACGKVNSNNTVTVSGMNFTMDEIDNYGKNDEELVDIFLEIEEGMKKKAGK